MNPVEHRRLAELEDRMWHFAALHGHVWGALRRAGVRPDAAILDAGCGTAGFLRRLRDWWPQARLRGVELSVFAVQLARERAPCPVDEGSVTALPFGDATFDAITCIDVTYQLETPVDAYREMARCLRPGGVLVVNEPAHPWLWSYHDERVGGRRRFTRRELVETLRAAGLQPAWGTHWNCLALPLVWGRRKFGPAPEGSDVQDYPVWVTLPLRALNALERAGLALGLRFPFGVSVLFVAVKPPAVAAGRAPAGG